MRCFDGHCDTLARCMTTGEGLRQNGGHVDLARCAALGQHAQIFAVFADSSKTSAPLYTVAQRQHALLERECARNADLVRRCRTAWDVRAAWAAGKTAALLGIEGAELLDFVKNKEDFSMVGGFFKPLTKPGLGVEIDEAKVIEFSKNAPDWRNPLWRHEDNSVAEW